MLKLILLLTLTTFLSGCALTDYAKDYFVNAVDLNNYEAAKNIDNSICDPDVLSRLQKTRSEEWYKETVIDCQRRKDQAVPLTN